VVLIFYFATFC